MLDRFWEFSLKYEIIKADLYPYMYMGLLVFQLNLLLENMSLDTVKSATRKYKFGELLVKNRHLGEK